MQKIKFFIGTPTEIPKEFEKWQSENPTFQIKGLQQAIAVLPLPGGPPQGIVPAGVKGVTIQIQTFLCMLVIYEDLPSDSP